MSSGLGFIDLPAEVRMMIYRFIFILDEPINLTWFIRKAKERLSAQLLRTCGTIHHEGRTVLYGENAFSLAPRLSVPDYVRVQISQLEHFGTNTDLIRHLEFHGKAVDALNSMRSMRSLRPMLQNLESLKITISETEICQSCYTSPPKSIGKPYAAGLQEWLKKTRGPFQKLTRIFVNRTLADSPNLVLRIYYVDFLLLSDNTRMKSVGIPVDINSEMSKVRSSDGYRIGLGSDEDRIGLGSDGDHIGLDGSETCAIE